MTCDEDVGQCRVAVDCGIPIVTSEFLLTGILQQKLDVDAYPLVCHMLDVMMCMFSKCVGAAWDEYE